MYEAYEHFVVKKLYMPLIGEISVFKSIIYAIDQGNFIIQNYLYMLCAKYGFGPS